MRPAQGLLALVLGLVGAFGILPRAGSSAQEAPDLKAIVEGMYTLREWHIAQEVLRPPAVDGRFVLLEGIVVTVLRNSSNGASKISGMNYGSYTLEPSSFSYKYEEATLAIETPTDAKVSHKLIFDGTRTFAISREADGVHFRRAEGGIEFLFTPDSLTYSEGGKVLRVWQRVKAARRS